ncbi:MAG: hypothetical protein I3J02_12220 [Prevotella sp.]|nr:hypothetical protein [Prevotella sp.]
MTELQCNCPRCGTPFTYTVEDTAPPSPNETSAQNTAEPVPDGAARVEKSPVTGRWTQHETSSDKGLGSVAADRTPSQSVSGRVPPPIPPHIYSTQAKDEYRSRRNAYDKQRDTSSMARRKKKGGCFKRFLVISACVVVVGVFMQQQCESSSSYNAETLGITETDRTHAPAEQIAIPAPSFDNHAARESAPSWIQGNWHVDTDYGGISLKIYGNNIAETSGGETSYGHYRYQNHWLYCDFGDNNVFVYRLVEETKQIDAGSGMLMRKID